MLKIWNFKMIIKAVLFLTVVLNIGKYESVHCSHLLDSYLNIKVQDFESFNVMCHRAIYTIIYSESYNIGPAWINLSMENRIKRMYSYMLRLHRIWYNGNRSKLNILRDESWTFFKYFVDWINNNSEENKNIMDGTSVILISNGGDAGIWNCEPMMYLDDFEYCDTRLEELSKKSEDEILAGELKKVFYNQGQKICDTNNTKEIIEFPVLIEYGFILLLLKKEEKLDFMRSTNENEKKIFVVDMMKEALVNTFFTIMMELKQIGSLALTAKQIKYITYKDDESTVNLLILKSIFMKIIDATEAVFNIQEERKNYSGILQYRLDGIRTSRIIVETKKAIKTKSKIPRIDLATVQFYPDLKEEYNTYMDMVKAKLNQICSELVTKEHKRDKKLLNEEIKVRFPGRLTVGNSIRVSLLSLFSVTVSDLPDEPFMKRLINDNNSRSKLLLELYAWMLNIKQYADLMNNGMSREHKTQVTTKDQTKRFIDDRKFLEVFQCK